MRCEVFAKEKSKSLEVLVLTDLYYQQFILSVNETLGIAKIIVETLLRRRKGIKGVKMLEGWKGMEYSIINILG